MGGWVNQTTPDGFMSSVFGYRIPRMGTIRAPIGQALSTMVVTYLFTLGGVYILALSIDVLAPNFHGTKNRSVTRRASVPPVDGSDSA